MIKHWQWIDKIYRLLRHSLVETIHRTKLSLNTVLGAQRNRKHQAEHMEGGILAIKGMATG